MLTPLQMAAILEHVAAKLQSEAHEILEPVAVMLETSAKDAIGNSSYPFGWPRLSQATIDKHGDTPLLDTGALQSSISHVVEGTHAYVGTNDEKAAWQEFGTSRIPPRPFLGGALAHDGDKIPEIVHAALEKIFR
jgi:phage gpG-like protein